jgi:Eukaryotic aspartyl protease
MIILLLWHLCYSLDLYNYDNVQHYGYVKLGDQELPVMFDTGSTSTWVASIDCYSRGCNRHKKYNPYTSKTYKSLHTSFEIQYGSGRIRGELAKETIIIDKYNLKDIEIGLVLLEIGEVFEKIPFTGIVGISPNSNQFSFVQQLYNQFNVTTISISLSETLDEPGYIGFEVFSPALMHKSLSLNYWEIELTDFRIGDYDFCKSINTVICKGVIDTGTSVLSVPSNIYYQFIRLYHITNDCNNARYIPSMSIGIWNKVYEIESLEYITYDSGICSLALMKLDVPEPVGPFFVLGGTFLRKTVLYLNTIDNEIGLIAKPGIFIKNKIIKL